MVEGSVSTPGSAGMVAARHTISYLPFAALLLALLTRIAHAQSSFYWPKRGTPRPPISEDYSVRSVSIPNRHATLAGWVLEPTSANVVGTVVYCHGNGGNMEHHVGFVDFLPSHGFRVLMFDYQGYGESSPNEPTRASTVSDVNAAIDFSIERWGKPWLMGQSLGAALAIATAGERPADVRGVIAVAPFTSYRAVARAVLRRSIVTRPLVMPSYVIVRGGYDPIDLIGNIAPTPILLVHGERDELIPPRMSRELFEKARSPKDIMIVPDARHSSTWSEMGPVYIDQVASFLTRADVNNDRPTVPVPRRTTGSRATLSR